MIMITIPYFDPEVPRKCPKCMKFGLNTAIKIPANDDDTLDFGGNFDKNLDSRRYIAFAGIFCATCQLVVFWTGDYKLTPYQVDKIMKTVKQTSLIEGVFDVHLLLRYPGKDTDWLSGKEYSFKPADGEIILMNEDTPKESLIDNINWRFYWWDGLKWVEEENGKFPPSRIGVVELQPISKLYYDKLEPEVTEIICLLQIHVR